MKNLYLSLLCILYCCQLNAQSRMYATPVVMIDQYIRDSVHVVGQLDLTFPEDGEVLVQFDGEGFGSPNDRIILGANIYPQWDTNEGNVHFDSSIEGEGHCFSHTRRFSVMAGQHSFYAVAQNYVFINGTGKATIYGTLSVEYIPNSSNVVVANTIKTEFFSAMQKVAFDSVTVQVPGPGKIEVRLNGSLEPLQGDHIFAGISAGKDWSYADPKNVELETNNPYETAISFSNTQIFTVDEAGTYTYYAMVQRALEEEGNGYVYSYTNFHTRFYPEDGEQIVLHTDILEDNLLLNDHLKILDSITIDIIDPGKMEIRFDGSLQSPLGNNILISANDQPTAALQGGRIFLQTNDSDLDHHPFVHTQVFDVQPGEHTFYVMAQHDQGIGTISVDLNGHFLVKYFPEKVVSATEKLDNLAFEIFPNPTSQDINIQVETVEGNQELLIYDLNGRLIHHHNNIAPGETQDLSSLPPGMYMAELRNQTGRGFKKLVKE